MLYAGEQLGAVNLTDLVVDYRAGNLPYSEISGRISLFVYDYPRRFAGWNSGRCDYFFESIHSMLRTFVDAYTSVDTPFEDYIARCIEPIMKDFNVEQ